MGLLLPPSSMTVIHILPLLFLVVPPALSQGSGPPGRGLMNGPPGGGMMGPPGGGMMGPPGGGMGPPPDIDPKEFIVGILKNYSVGAKAGIQMPPQALQHSMIDMIPENHNLKKSSEKLLKPKIIFRRNGEVAAFDSEKGEELTMISATREVNDEVYNKIFSEEFFDWFMDIQMKKQVLIKKLKEKRQEAKTSGKNITETVQTKNSDGIVHEKVFTFLADGSVHLDDKEEAPSGRNFAADIEIDAEVFDTIFPQDLFENFNVEGDEDWNTTAGVERSVLTLSVIMCVMFMVVVSG